MFDINRQQASEITAEIKAAVEAILAKRGLTISSSKNTYGAGYSIKIEAAESSRDMHGINHSSPEALMYGHEEMRQQFGLKDGLVGRLFEMHGEQFRFLGISPKKSRNPLVARRESDKAICVMPAWAANFVNEAK